MTSQWSLPELFANLHDKIQLELATARNLGHPTDKGDASENAWINVLRLYLPKRYEVRKGFVVDSLGSFSQQIDIIIHDRHYSPFVFSFNGTDIIPAESVYAVFEAKQEISSAHIIYAMQKAKSVRELYRTSTPVPTVDGISRPKSLHHIISGILTLSSPWNPPLGFTLQNHLRQEIVNGALDLGCVANSGWFCRISDNDFSLFEVDKPATRFLFELIAQLQAIGTAPMLDVRAYAKMI